MAIDPDLPFVIAALAIVAGTVITLARTFVNRRPTGVAAPAELRQIEERLTRIEQAVDSIAVETERISEGQRFTTRVLAERGQRTGPAPGDPPPAG